MQNVSITSLAMSQDCTKLIMGNSAGHICFWESEGDQLISSSENGQQQVNHGSTEDFNPMQEFVAHEAQYILRVRLSKNNKFMATCSSDRCCKIWIYNSEVEEFEHYKNRAQTEMAISLQVTLHNTTLRRRPLFLRLVLDDCTGSKQQAAVLARVLFEGPGCLVGARGRGRHVPKP